MIYEVIRVFSGNAHSYADLMLEEAADRFTIRIDEFERFADAWADDFRLRETAAGPGAYTVGAQQGVVYDRKGLYFLIVSGRPGNAQITRYTHQVRDSGFTVVAEPLAPENPLVREISRLYADQPARAGWAEPLWLAQQGWLLPYYVTLSADRLLLMLAPLAELYSHLEARGSNATVSIFLTLLVQPGNTSTPGAEGGAHPGWPDYLKTVSATGITAGQALHWSDLLSGLDEVTLYYPQALLPGLSIGLSYQATDIYERLQHYLLLGFVLALTVAGILSAIVRRGIRFFSRSVTDLHDHLELVSAGDLEARLPEQQRYRELTRITAMVNRLLEQLQRHVDELRKETEKSASLASEIAIAGRIQQDLLVRDIEKIAGRYHIDIAGLLAPAKKIAGDFYCLVPRPDGKLLFAVGDVSGKGIAAALVAKDCVSLVESLGQDSSPAQLLQQMNASLFEKFARQSMFVTLFCCLLDTETAVLFHCDAGHEAPLLHRGGEERIGRLTIERNMALGFQPDTLYKETSMQLEKDHTLLLYTDGLDGDMRRGDDQSDLPLGVAILGNRILRNTDLQTKIQCINNFALDKQGGEPYDDITLLAVRPEKSGYRSFHIPAQLGEIGAAIGLLRAQLQDRQVEADCGNRLSVVLDEWVSNLIKHAGVDSDIIFNTRCAPAGVNLEIIARCDSSFDPLQTPELNVREHLQSQVVGGFGIHIIRNMVDEVSYDTRDGWARLAVRVNSPS